MFKTSQFKNKGTKKLSITGEGNKNVTFKYLFSFNLYMS